MRVAILVAWLTSLLGRVAVSGIADEMPFAVLALRPGCVVQTLQTVARVVLVLALGIPVTFAFWREGGRERK